MTLVLKKSAAILVVGMAAVLLCPVTQIMLTAAAVLACALDLLGRSTTLAPVRFDAAPPTGVSAHAEAFVTHNPDTIVLITSSAAFRAAQRAHGHVGGHDGCRKIASVIVHEEWHLQHGADEREAYLAQLTTLSAIGASGLELSAVRRAMAAVLRARRHRSEGPSPPLASAALVDD